MLSQDTEELWIVLTAKYLMATFVNVYIYSFVSTPTLQKTVQQVFTLRPEEQLQLFYVLKGSLENRGILNIQ